MMDWEDIMLERPVYALTSKKKTMQMRSRRNSQHAFSQTAELTPVEHVRQKNKLLLHQNPNIQRNQHYNQDLLFNSQHSELHVRSSSYLPAINQRGETNSQGQQKEKQGPEVRSGLCSMSQSINTPISTQITNNKFITLQQQPATASEEDGEETMQFANGSIAESRATLEYGVKSSQKGNKMMRSDLQPSQTVMDGGEGELTRAKQVKGHRQSRDAKQFATLSATKTLADTLTRRKYSKNPFHTVVQSPDRASLQEEQKQFHQNQNHLRAANFRTDSKATQQIHKFHNQERRSMPQIEVSASSAALIGVNEGELKINDSHSKNPFKAKNSVSGSMASPPSMIIKQEELSRILPANDSLSNSSSMIKLPQNLRDSYLLKAGGAQNQGGSSMSQHSLNSMFKTSSMNLHQARASVDRVSNYYNNLSSSSIINPQRNQSLDKDYDNTMIGPDSYKGANWSTFELIAQQKESKVHKQKSSFSFSQAQKANGKQFLSREQWKQEHMLNCSPPVGLYDPDMSKVQRSVTKEISIKEYPPRFDDYSFKKSLQNSPSVFHEVRDSREISYQDEFKVKTKSFTQGPRRGFPNQRAEHDLVPSPDQYNLKSLFEVNKNRAFLIDRPRELFVQQNETKVRLKEGSGTVGDRIENEMNRGPGLYDVEKVDRGKLSHVKSSQAFPFLKSERDYRHMKVGDKALNLAPGQYFEPELERKRNWVKTGRIAIGPTSGPQGQGEPNLTNSQGFQIDKDFDIRKFDQRMQMERIKNKRTYI